MAPTTVSELMTAAAEALMNKDADTLWVLKQLTCNWLQTEEETRAQQAMLEAMIDACES